MVSNSHYIHGFMPIDVLTMIDVDWFQYRCVQLVRVRRIIFDFIDTSHYSAARSPSDVVARQSLTL